MGQPRFAGPLATAALVSTLWAAPASAQDRLFVREAPSPDRAPGPAEEFGAIAPLGRPLGARPFWVSSDQAGGGSYMVHFRGRPPILGTASPAVIVETVTGRQFTVAGTVVAVDPIRPRVFAWQGDTLRVEDLSTGAATTVLSGVDLADAAAVQYAPNVDVLFVSRAAALLAIDGTSGAVQRTLPALGPVASVPDLIYPDMGAAWVASADGTRIFAVAADGSAVRIIDGVSGAEITRSALAGGASGVLMPDWAGDRLFVVQGAVHAWLLSALTTAGASLGNAPLGGYCPPTLRSSPSTGRLYMSSFGGGGGGTNGVITMALSAYDGATLGALGRATIAGTLDLCGGIQLVLVSPPGAPRRPAAVVNGHDVALSWTNAGDAVDFVLDVGLVPGQTVATLPLGGNTSAALTGVPSGRYYARVRGGNLFGTSPPSSEFTIIVP